MRNERGGSAVIAVVVLPLLLVFLFAVIDLGRIVFFHAELNTATHAVCQRLKADEGGISSLDELKREAFQASPALSAEGVNTSITYVVGPVEESTFAQKIYDRDKKAFDLRQGSVQKRTLSVEMTLRAHYLTPLGSALEAVSGTQGSGFEVFTRTQTKVDIGLKGGA